MICDALHHQSSLIAHSSWSIYSKTSSSSTMYAVCVFVYNARYITYIRALWKCRGPQQYNPDNGDNNRIIQSRVQDAVYSGRRMGYAYQFTIILSANAISRENLPTSYSSVIATVINILLLYQFLSNYTCAWASTINQRKGI